MSVPIRIQTVCKLSKPLSDKSTEILVIFNNFTCSDLFQEFSFLLVLIVFMTWDKGKQTYFYFLA